LTWKATEQNPWFWGPSNLAVRSAPDWFRPKLVDISRTLAVTWNPVIERWQVWVESPKTNNIYSRGWRLLFVHHGPDYEYLPLDERLLARVFYADATHYGSAEKYFTRLQNELAHDKAQREAKSLDETQDAALDYWRYGQIKNIGQGNKYTKYLS
jgi:hypothetical protein